MPTPECYRGLPGLPRLSNAETEMEAETPMPGGGGGGIGVFAGVLPRRGAFSTGLVAVAETTTVSHLSVDLSQNRLYQKRMPIVTRFRVRQHRRGSSPTAVTTGFIPLSVSGYVLVV
jgi:hypothetical protein